MQEIEESVVKTLGQPGPHAKVTGLFSGSLLFKPLGLRLSHGTSTSLGMAHISSLGMKRHDFLTDASLRVGRSILLNPL